MKGRRDLYRFAIFVSVLASHEKRGVEGEREGCNHNFCFGFSFSIRFL